VKGLKGPLGCLTQARYGITWGPIGAAISSYTCALEYSKSRILFNRPIAATQAVQLKLPTWRAASRWRSCCRCSWAA
jgi:glutaryl-CoA dehydrogenase